MPALPHQLILPATSCYQNPHHQIATRPRTTGTGRYEYCLTCSLGYTMALEQLGNETEADRFVQTLRH